MAAASALAVGTDALPSKGTTSPVAYPVDKVTGNLVRWSDKAGAVYALNKLVSLSWREPTSKSPLYRISLNITDPYDRPVTDAGSNTTHIVGGSLQAKLEFIVPINSTSAERTEFIRSVVQKLLDTQFTGSVASLTFPF